MSKHLRLDLQKLLGKDFNVEITGGPQPSLVITKVSKKKSVRVWASEYDGELLHHNRPPTP